MAENEMTEEMAKTMLSVILVAKGEGQVGGDIVPVLEYLRTKIPTLASKWHTLIDYLLRDFV